MQILGFHCKVDGTWNFNLSQMKQNHLKCKENWFRQNKILVLEYKNALSILHFLWHLKSQKVNGRQFKDNSESYANEKQKS